MGKPQVGDYALVQPTPTANITPAPLTITALTNTKSYDGTITAAASPTVSGLQGSDTLTGLSEVYSDANAGSGKTLNVVPGYNLVATLTGSVTPNALAIDSSGNLYAVNGHNSVNVYPPGARLRVSPLPGWKLPMPWHLTLAARSTLPMIPAPAE